MVLVYNDLQRILESELICTELRKYPDFLLVEGNWHFLSDKWNVIFNMYS